MGAVGAAGRGCRGGGLTRGGPPPKHATVAAAGRDAASGAAMSEIRAAAMEAKAWPFEEARRILKRYETAPPEKGFVLFQLHPLEPARFV